MSGVLFEPAAEAPVVGSPVKPTSPAYHLHCLSFWFAFQVLTGT